MRRAGYTLIEVMTAVVVMTIGATGIVAMQGAAVHANQEANDVSTANNFAATWLERLKRDGRLWIANGNTDLGNTTWLKTVNTSSNTWFVPNAADAAALEQPAADYQGFDTSTDFDVNARFCANVRLVVVQAYNPLTSGVSLTTDANAVRSDVRVWWWRSGQDADRSKVAKCRDGGLSDANAALPYIRSAYLTNVISWRAPGWP
jgi:prepilin-type N-terminal cleavage/methylation domain-containing protein